MNDRELLEMAHKASGLSAPAGIYSDGTYWWYNSTMDGEGSRWNPLEDDGDALRLAVKLNISIMQNIVRVEASTIQLTLARVFIHEDTIYQDQRSATRRAIVRAAAAMGEDL